MEAPRLPSMFKTFKNKKFNFKPRYLSNKNKDKRTSLKFRSKNNAQKQQNQSLRVVIFIIMIGLIVYLIFR